MKHGKLLFRQIFFHGKDFKLLREQVGDQCVPKRYGGTVEIPEGTGTALADLFQVYTKDFESKLNGSFRTSIGQSIV